MTDQMGFGIITATRANRVRHDKVKGREVGRATGITEYDLHPRGAMVEDALSSLERIVSQARASGPKLFAVITGYGSSGGTAMIKDAVLKRCRRYVAQNHIRGYLDGEKAGDVFCAEFIAFPETWSIPAALKRSPNPGIVFIAV